MARHKILLVDDNQELLFLLARLVEREGWIPVTAQRGRTGLFAVSSEQPAVAVVDVLLPDMMGYEVGAALKRAGVPYIFMTGIFKGGRAASEARVQHGAAAYFEKPFAGAELVEAIRALLPGSPQREQAAAPPAHPPSAADFDVEVPVELDEPVAAMELTGRVEVTDRGGVRATLRGETLRAAPLAASVPPPTGGPSAGGPSTGGPPGAVQATAAAIARAAAMRADEGKLGDNLPDLITAFWLAQQTGELAVRRGKVKKAIYFDQGRPCFAISNSVPDRLGPFLVRVGKITPMQQELIQAAVDRTGRRVGDVLIDMKLLREAERLYYVGQQIKAIAYSIFGWEDGSYRIHFTDRALREETRIDLHPAQLISRGVRKLYRPERLARLLPDAARLVPTQQPAYPLHEVDLETWEAQLLPRVDGTRSVAALAAIARRPADEVRGFLYAMQALAILEPVAP